jgi:hypothetical protein
MTKELLRDEQVLLIDRVGRKDSISVLKKFNFSPQTKIFVNEVLANKKTVLMIVPTKTNQAKDTSTPKVPTQNDFATLIRQVEKEVYGKSDL